MAKAKKQGASRKTGQAAKASKKVASAEAGKKKATRAKKPAGAAKKAVRKAVKRKVAAPAKRRTSTATRSKTFAVKKAAARKAKPVKTASKPAAASPKAAVAKRALKPAVATARFIGAAPAEYHSPATTVAKLRAAAASPARSVVATKQTAAAKKAPPKTARGRSGKATTLVVSPAAIDTSLAAEVAANMVLNHMVSGSAAGNLQRAVTDVFTQASMAAKSGRGANRETSTFKHMKESVANPTSHHLDGLFGVLATKKRPTLPFGKFPAGAAQPIDKDFGLDVKRTNHLRRKAG